MMPGDRVKPFEMQGDGQMPDSGRTPVRRGGARFGLKEMFLLFLPLAILFLVLGGLLNTGTLSRPRALILGIAAPVGLVVVLSVGQHLGALYRRYRRR